MLKRVISAAKSVVGLNPPGRRLLIFPDDTFLVSYPKSGNTWTRFLIANLVHPQEKVDFSNVHLIIPGPDVTSHRDMLRVPRPRIIKSHQCFDTRYPRIIYIVRDPRDVVLSGYHAQRKRKRIADDYPIEKFVQRFVAGETSDYGSWGDHAASWLSTRFGQPRLLLLRYEDMLADTPRELSRVASFLNLTPTSEQIQQAVARSSVNKMRELEKSQSQLFNATRSTRNDIMFVRRAEAGGWRAGLPESCVFAIESAWGHIIQWLGYELVSHGNSSVTESPFPFPALDRLVQ